MVILIQQAKAGKSHSIGSPANLMQLCEHKYFSIILLWAILGLGIEIHMAVEFRALQYRSTNNCLNKSILNLNKQIHNKDFSPNNLNSMGNEKMRPEANIMH